MTKKFHIIVVYLFIQTNILAQIPGFTQFSSSNGLPSNTVYDINQDENGLLWIATDYGLSRFDGLSFKNFTISDGLPDNEILTLFRDSKQRIWLIGFNGKLGFIQNNKFFNSKNLEFFKDLNFSNFVSDIFEDSKNNIWFLQSVNNIKKLDSSNKITNYKLENLPFKNNSNRVQITEDINGKIKILASLTNQQNINQILSCSFQDPVWRPLNLDLYDEKSILEVRRKKAEAFKNIDNVTMQISNIIFKDFNYDRTTNFLYQTLTFDDSFLITNLNEGAIIIDSKNKSQSKKILPSIRTSKSYLDREKNIWVGSLSNGLYLFPNVQVKGIQFVDKKKNDLYSVNVFQNKLVIGNEQSEIILLDTKTLDIITSYKVDEYLKRIRKLKVSDNSLYILSDLNVHHLNANLEIEKVKNMYDSDFRKALLKNFKDISLSDDYIFTANSNGIAKMKKSTYTPEKIWNKRSTSLLFTKKENLWIGTTTGLFCLKGNKIDKFDLSEQFNNSIIYSIEQSENGLLIGSNAFGLGILKNNVFSVLSKEDGLLSNYIKSIHIDLDNKIWLSTNFGLNCVELGIDNKIISIKSYTTSDGLYSNDVRSSYVDGNKIYVATSKGLNIIDLSKEVSSILVPNVHINDVLLNNSIIEKTNGQIFENHLNNAQFNFSGISFKSLGNITFKYRLIGLESDWISTNTNTVRYSSLPPNNYTFELKAVSKNNLESTPILFSFTINPPLYKTWWFILLSIVSLITLIIAIFYQRNLKLKRKQQTKEQISNLRYQALNAQMNPHFINNLLVNINSLADRGETKDVKDSLDKFAELVNLILTSTKSNLINLNNEIEMAKLYLELQKLRFSKNITYHINTESIPTEELDYILVPPMILQPIIENSFKHGFKNDSGENHISVNFKIENNEYLFCEILDNGTGIEINGQKQSNNSGISFSNINERLNLINDSSSKEELVLVSNIKNEFNNLAGLQVTLKIPLISL